MELIDNLSMPEDQKPQLRRAVERYKRAVRMRHNATHVDYNPLALSASTAEFRDALRALIQLGYPLDAINILYAETMAELEDSRTPD